MRFRVYESKLEQWLGLSASPSGFMSTPVSSGVFSSPHGTGELVPQRDPPVTRRTNGRFWDERLGRDPFVSPKSCSAGRKRTRGEADTGPDVHKSRSADTTQVTDLTGFGTGTVSGRIHNYTSDNQFTIMVRSLTGFLYVCTHKHIHTYIHR